LAQKNLKKKETNTYFFKAILLLISCFIAKMIATFFIKKKTFNYAEIT